MSNLRADAPLAIVAALLVAGCAATGGGAPDGLPGPRASALGREIEGLGSGVAREEARRVARFVVDEAAGLVEQYRMLRPPQLHNLFVNLGLRDRGLCCHFAEDLIRGLVELDLATLDVHWVVARHGSRLREHSSVVLVPKGLDYERGLVVDAWRRPGELFWSPVADDRYPWKLHPMSGDWQRLHCR